MRRVDEAAVSSVVGTVLILTITVTAFSGVSLLVLNEFDDAPGRQRADLDVIEGSGGVFLRHIGGPAVDSTDVKVVVNVNGSPIRLDATQLATLFGSPWAVGQTACVSCLFPGQAVNGVFVVTGNQLVFQHGEEGDAGLNPLGLPDLMGEITGASPPSPEVDDPVTFSATINNGQIGTAGNSTASFFVDGVLLSTHAIGALAAWETFDVTSAPWIAVQGSTEILFRVDAADDVTELDEDNNEDTMVLPIDDPSDPGFAYIDTDGDGIYTEGVDGAIDFSDLEDGKYDAGSAGLIIPASVGPISADRIDFKADGDIVIAVDLTAGEHKLELDAGQSLTIDGITLRTLDNQTINLDGGSLSAIGTTMISEKKLDINAGDMDLSGAHLETLYGDEIKVTSTGVMTAVGATFASQKTLDVIADGDMDLSFSAMSTPSNRDIKIDANADLVASNASWVAGGDLFVDGDGTGLLAGASLTTTGSDFIELKFTGEVNVDDATMNGPGGVTIESESSISAVGLAATSTENNADIELRSKGAIDVTNADLDADDNIILDRDAAGNVVTVSGASFRDANDMADINPGTTNIVGTPAFGGTE